MREQLSELLDAAAARKLMLKKHRAALVAVTGLSEGALLVLLRVCKETYRVHHGAYAKRQSPLPRPVDRFKTGVPAWDWQLRRDEDDWQLDGEDWDGLFGPREGSKGRNRTNLIGPPLPPLYAVFEILELSLRDRKRSFRPHLPNDKVRGDTPREALLHNLATADNDDRLFYFVARHVDPGYTLENCNSVMDGVKRQRKSVAGKEALKLKNSKAAQKSRAARRAKAAR